ncbi:MAG: Spy/CpxP family protein refolding chaperone [Pirellulales bacterium]|nr:Spy/CpxP family protein refolding chaperone [Pirellulales bacterium]
MKVASISTLCAGICCVLIVFSWSTREAQAQRPGRGMGGGMDITRLLGIEQVQKEINLTKEQITEIDKIREASRPPRRNREDMRKMREEMEKLSQEERSKKMESMMQERQKESEQRTKENMKKLSGILKKEQLIRVKQIQMQMEGVGVLRRPEVMTHLGLDDAQKEKLKKINEEVRDQMRELMRSGRNRNGDNANRDQSRQQMRENMQKAREEIEKKVMAVLKPDQKKKLGEMMGKPFKLDRSAFSRRGDGRRGEGRQGDQGRSRRDRQDSKKKN